jgi:hypothetical protein
MVKPFTHEELTERGYMLFEPRSGSGNYFYHWPGKEKIFVYCYDENGVYTKAIWYRELSDGSFKEYEPVYSLWDLDNQIHD